VDGRISDFLSVKSKVKKKGKKATNETPKNERHFIKT